MRPPGWESAPHIEPCWKGERSIMATFGPDWILLVPAVHRLMAAELQKEVGALNYYFICTRPRIRAINSEMGDSVLTVSFQVAHDDGSVEVLRKSSPIPWNVRAVRVVDGGAAIEYDLTNGVAKHDAGLTAQALFLKQPYEPSVFDLEVRYVGRARGPLANHCALDRLENHKKYQAVMEEVLQSPARNRDVWLVLGAGTAMDTASFGGKNLTPLTDAELVKERDKIRSTLSTNRRIDVTEALLINHFKPILNEQHVGELNLKSKTLGHCYDAGLTGLQLVLPTAEWGIALYTKHVKPTLWHSKTVCLYGDGSPE